METDWKFHFHFHNVTSLALHLDPFTDSVVFVLFLLLWVHVSLFETFQLLVNSVNSFNSTALLCLCDDDDTHNLTHLKYPPNSASAHINNQIDHPSENNPFVIFLVPISPSQQQHLPQYYFPHFPRCNFTDDAVSYTHLTLPTTPYV